jgi:hypothetical protein
MKEDDIDRADLGNNPFTSKRFSKSSDEPLEPNDEVEFDDIDVRTPDEILKDKRRAAYLEGNKRLSPDAILLLTVIMCRTNRERDYAYINSKGLAFVVGKTTSQVTAATKRLVKHGIICHTHKKDVYWLNPKFIFGLKTYE